jgi:hypothetical protein
MNFYTAYGLRIASAFQIGELERVEPGPCDLTVRFAPVARRRPEVNDAPYFDFSEPEVYLGWPGFARFLLKSTTEIDVVLEENGEEFLLALPLLGVVLALILSRRGYLVLHGSSVAVGENAVMFLGDKEAGKSTTAAAMLASGCALISDDVVAVDMAQERPRIVTAYPSLKLSESASAHYAPSGAALLQRPYDEFPKDRFRLSSNLERPLTPASAVYILERGDDFRSDALSPQDAMAAMIRFSYLARFGDKLLGGTVAASHFRQCAALSHSVPVRRLQVPDALDRVKLVPGFIAADLQR